MGITGFVIKDILKNKIVVFYTILLAVFSWGILNLEDTSTKSILSLLNVVLLIVPLVSIIFSTIYLYNSSEFIELLVSQPVKRSSIWSSLFYGLAIALNVAFLLGVGLPIVFLIPDISGLILCVSGMLITTIFVAISMMCAITMRDKARGIGFSIILWLMLTLVYDGLVLFFMFQFSDYPIEKLMVVLTSLNPIDLARIMVILQVDVAALMGYTGAIFKNLFGTTLGLLMSLSIMVFWIIAPYFLSLKLFKRKDL